MRLLAILLATTVLSPALRASDVARPKPTPPGWPTESFAVISGRCRGADLAVFEFGSRKIFVTERAWLDAFDAALATDHAKPDAYCFCISDPVLKLYAKNQFLGRVELTHDSKIRFTGGDFIVPADTHVALRKLWAIAMKIESYAPPKKSAKHSAPPRVELQP